MEPHEYLATLRKRWIVILTFGIIGAVVGLAYAASLQPIYRSTSSVFVSSQRGETSSEILQGSSFTQAQVQSYAALATLPVVLDPVIKDLNLNVTAQDLAPSVTADISLNTVIIDVTVTNSSAESAAEIANAVTAELSTQAERLEARSKDGGGSPVSPVTMTTVASAQVPDAPFSPNTRFIVLSGLLGGLILAIGGSIAYEFLDTRMRGPRDAERVGPQPFLGSVSRRKRSDTSVVVMRSDPYGTIAEDFRRISTNLDFADIDNPIRSIVVTSASPAEGKSTISINIALAMAERLERVLLIDADLRKPSMATYCGIDGTVGLTSVLVGSAALEDAIRPWADGAIDILPSGVVPANPSQMLGSEAMADLLRDLVARYDFVVVDSPPLLPVTDSLTIAKLTDGAVVVSRFKKTRRQQFSEALESIEGVSARVIGTVLNATPRTSKDSYYSYAAAPAGAGEVGSSAASMSATAAQSDPETASDENAVGESVINENAIDDAVADVNGADETAADEGTADEDGLDEDGLDEDLLDEGGLDERVIDQHVGEIGTAEAEGMDADVSSVLPVPRAIEIADQTDPSPNRRSRPPVPDGAPSSRARTR